ncbi:hypothetical protein [Aquiflexum lacus]|uniref:hypothetical protein n=1 Tax=Aquiflexum lacus TaxID=2483805 RepID=UPI001893FC9B|nr:hypothetical protein [Aquiflexum lacus]
MKKLLLSLFCLIVSVGLFAATRTVSNNAGDVAQFTSIQEAVDASSDGDIILISGSSTSYGSFTVNIRLTIIGPGANTDFNGGANATIGTLTFGSNQASQSILLGLNIGAIIIGVADCDEVQVRRCQVNYLYHSPNDPSRIPQNWLLEENNLYGSGVYNYYDNNLTANWTIRNNYMNTCVINGSILSNNVYYAGSIQGRANVITNSVFYGSSFSLNQSSIANSIFNNAPNIDFSANSGSGNFLETDPQFVNFTFSSDLYRMDLSLQPGSVGINAGTDGTDIGLFGGKGFLVSGLPGIPSVESLVILNPTVPQNGTLNIQVEGKANN